MPLMKCVHFGEVAQLKIVFEHGNKKHDAFGIQLKKLIRIA